MVEIVEVQNKKQLKEFVNFPNVLYKDNPYFVPINIKPDLENFDTEKNPVYQHAWCRQFLAYKNGVLAGRIAILQNEWEYSKQGISKVRFGWFDFENDIEVATALIEQLEKIAQEKEVEYIEGPLGFTNLDKAGMLTFGFDELASFIGLYNDSYYPEFMQKLGFEEQKKYIEFKIDAPQKLGKILKLKKLIEEKYKVRIKVFKNKKELEPYIDNLFDLLKNSYSQLSTYVPLSDDQIEFYKEKYMKILNLKFMQCAVNEKDELVGFAIISPSYSKVIQQTNWKLFPFGWYKFLKATKKNTHGEFILIGVKPEYQKKGVTAILFAQVFEIIKELGILTFETNPQLEENMAVQTLWKPYNPRVNKRRATFIKKLK